MFLRNAWYLAGWDYEIGREIQVRTILGEEMILYRKEDGTPAALQNSCSHRRAPLSMARLVGDRVECAYHGLTFDGAGMCVHIPGQKNVPESAHIRSYPVAEKWTGVWIWMGDAAKADIDLIPSFHWNTDPAWVAARGSMHMKANYQLMVENLLDLTHLGYLHRNSIGNPESAETGKATTKRTETSVHLHRATADCVTPPYYRELRGLPEMIDRTNSIDFVAPANVIIESAAAPAGGGLLNGDKSQSKTHMVLNAVTPETETTLNYYWSNLRNYRLDDQKMTDEYGEGLYKVFNEDREMVEAQQRFFDTHPGAQTTDLNVDSAVMEARRINARLIEQEQKKAA